MDQDIIDINEEGAERDEREIEKEGSEYFTAPPPRMAKSDGEIIENYQFDLDEESQAVMQDNGLEYMQDEEASEDGDNQISLHGDGEDDYEVALKDKNMRFNFEHGVNSIYLFRISKLLYREQLKRGKKEDQPNNKNPNTDKKRIQKRESMKKEEKSTKKIIQKRENMKKEKEKIKNAMILVTIPNIKKDICKDIKEIFKEGKRI